MKRAASCFRSFLLGLAIITNIFAGAPFEADAANWALSFDGTGTGATITNDPVIPFDALPLTVTFWMQTTQTTAAVSGLVTKSTAPASLIGWQVFLTNGQLRASYCVSPVRNVGGSDGLAGPVIADGLWHYVAFVVDTNSARLYVDAGLPATSLWTGLPGSTLLTNDIHLGAFATLGSSRPFIGAMDEITIWGVALTPIQIASNTNGFTGNELGLNAYYRCNEGIGPTLLDSAPAAGTNNAILDPSVAYIPSTIGSNTPSGPTVQTITANVGATNALLIGSMNPGGINTAGWFQWGTTTNYGNSTAAYLDSGTSDVQFYIGINNLSGGTIYHYRAVASNSVGMAFGNDMSFATPIFGLVYTNLLPLALGAVSWGDYDNDGLLDIFITGQNLSSGLVNNLVYRNTGTGFSNVFVTFSEVFPNQHSAWSDFDNDGRLDLLLLDYDANGYGTVDIFKNTSAGFTNADTFETNLVSANATWVDFDGDGLPDVFLYGQQKQYPPQNIAELWRNTGTGFQNLGLTFPPSCYNYGVQLAWGDYDGDGRPDLLISYSGYDANLNVIGITELWRNTGNGFSNINAGLTGVYNGTVGWADYDGDGKLDIILTGVRLASHTNSAVPLQVVSEIWRNTGNGFSNINANLTPIYNSCISWGDYDNDGKLDLILCGNTNPSNAVTQVWRNTGTNFSLAATLPPLFDGSVAWGDYDNDGRLDILLAGVTAFDTNGIPTQAVSQVWRNFTAQTNSPPSAPMGLRVTASGGGNSSVRMEFSIRWSDTRCCPHLQPARWVHSGRRAIRQRECEPIGPKPFGAIWQRTKQIIANHSELAARSTYLLERASRGFGLRRFAIRTGTGLRLQHRAHADQWSRGSRRHKWRRYRGSVGIRSRVGESQRQRHRQPVRA